MTARLSFRDRINALRAVGMRPGLDSIRALLAELDHPERDLPCIHVAGTNGKGAVCALLDAVLTAAGYRTARYTSPHLVALNERFFIGGQPVTHAQLESIAEVLFNAIDHLTARGVKVSFFEGLTAAAFLLFKRARPDVIILEAGLGGRDDATNVIDAPLVTVLTRIGLDHCAFLGHTYAEIATIKAGILKRGCPVVCGAMPSEARAQIVRIAATLDCPVREADKASSSPLALAGAYNQENAATVLAVVDVLCAQRGFRVPPTAIQMGFTRVVWPGRFQHVTYADVSVIIDGAHNPDGTLALVESLRREGLAGRVAFVCGYCADKDILTNVRILSTISKRAWAVPTRNSRTLAPDELAACMQTAGFAAVEAYDTFNEGLQKALAWGRETGGCVVICGSLFLAGEALVALNAYPWSLYPHDLNETLTPSI